MRKDLFLNLFWLIVWAVVLIGAIVSVFWKPAVYAVILIAAIMVGMFLHDYIKVARM